MSGGIEFAPNNAEGLMSHNDKQDKKQRDGGPEAHPINVTPKRNNDGPGGGEGTMGGNKVSQGRDADTGNKGKK